MAILFSLGIGLIAYSGVKNPTALPGLLESPREERSITQVLATEEKIREAVISELEEWFYGHRPHGLMLVAWDRLDEVVGVWVRPRAGLSVKPGAQHLVQEMRDFAGPFMFGECLNIPASSIPGKVLVACPIFNGYDVWGWVAAVVDSDPKTVDYTMRSLKSLASRLGRTIY